MAAPEPVRSAKPDDAEALAAARAGFWARWRRDKPSDADARRPLVYTTLAAAPEVKADTHEPSPCLNGLRRQQAESLRLWIERRIAPELDRCERCMSPGEWREHREWIEEYARVSLWEVLARYAAGGKI